MPDVVTLPLDIWGPPLVCLLLRTYGLAPTLALLLAWQRAQPVRADRGTHA